MPADNHSKFSESASWRKELRFDPFPPLLRSGNLALLYFVDRDLLERNADSIECLWKLRESERILRKQLDDGSWPHPGEEKHPAINRRLVETFRNFRFLVEKYGFTRTHSRAERAAEYLFKCQTADGDFRGILANQYATYYTGAILALLVQAGYADDPRVEKAFQWLLSMRQNDGGWTIPILTHKLDGKTQYRLTSEYAEPLEPDRTKPFSHNWTGMVLRAFAAHPTYRRSDAAKTAAGLLKYRFFKPDTYSSRQSANYWIRFEFPYWWNNLLSALDSLFRVGVSKDDDQIQLALQWLAEHQQEDGLWKTSYMKPGEKEKQTPTERERKLWISLAICRLFSRSYDTSRV